MAESKSTNERGRLRVVLACEACGARNYRTTIARRESSQPLHLKKFCKHCNAHTLHRESK